MCMYVYICFFFKFIYPYILYVGISFEIYIYILLICWLQGTILHWISASFERISQLKPLFWFLCVSSNQGFVPWRSDYWWERFGISTRADVWWLWCIQCHEGYKKVWDLKRFHQSDWSLDMSQVTLFTWTVAIIDVELFPAILKDGGNHSQIEFPAYGPVRSFRSTEWSASSSIPRGKLVNVCWTYVKGFYLICAVPGSKRSFAFCWV